MGGTDTLAGGGDVAGHADLGAGAARHIGIVGGGTFSGKVGDLLHLEKVQCGGRGG